MRNPGLASSCGHPRNLSSAASDKLIDRRTNPNHGRTSPTRAQPTRDAERAARRRCATHPAPVRLPSRSGQRALLAATMLARAWPSGRRSGRPRMPRWRAPERCRLGRGPLPERDASGRAGTRTASCRRGTGAGADHRANDGGGAKHTGASPRQPRRRAPSQRRPRPRRRPRRRPPDRRLPPITNVWLIELAGWKLQRSARPAGLSAEHRSARSSRRARC